jgi:hypothetical protein
MLPACCKASTVVVGSRAMVRWEEERHVRAEEEEEEKEEKWRWAGVGAKNAWLRSRHKPAASSNVAETVTRIIIGLFRVCVWSEEWVGWHVSEPVCVASRPSLKHSLRVCVS